MDKSTNRFSRHAFGGGERGERLAYEALLAHEARLLPGTKVRVYRGNALGMVGTVVEGDSPGSSCIYVKDSDGLRWSVETRNLEICPSE